MNRPHYCDECGLDLESGCMTDLCDQCLEESQEAFELELDRQVAEEKGQ